jgi:hypothetical protein
MLEARCKKSEVPETDYGSRCTMHDERTMLRFGVLVCLIPVKGNLMKKDRSKNDEVRMTNSPPEDPVGESIKRRVARWEAKYKPERLAAILAAKSERMGERYAVQAEMLGRVDHRISEVTDAAGVSVINRMWFKSFGREVSRIWRTIPSSCQELEYDVVRYKWTARGLDPILLAKVKAAVVELLDSSDFPRKNEEPRAGEVRG